MARGSLSDSAAGSTTQYLSTRQQKKYAYGGTANRRGYGSYVSSTISNASSVGQRLHCLCPVLPYHMPLRHIQ
eukprot:2532307-Rhodomonas_salina.3